MEKYCPGCKINKNYNEFYKDKYSKDGIRSRCILCHKKYHKSRKKEKSLYNKKYRIKNREKLLKNMKNYYELNKEKMKNGSALYYKRNKKHQISNMKKYQKREKEKIALRRLLKYHKNIVLPFKNFSSDNLKELLKIQKNKCYACGYPSNGESLALDHDHITGKIRGWAHAHCNNGIIYWLDYQYNHYPEDREKLLSNPDYRRILLNPPASYLYTPLDKSSVV